MSKNYTDVSVSYTEDHLQALMAAISYLRISNRDITANDLADLLLALGGPDMTRGLSPRHEGIV